MAGQRFLPLIVTVLLGTVMLILRLFQVQIVEREIWADEAANLVRSGNVLPYRRGSILDARGRVLAHDEVVYRVVFNYRDFRRGHPLGLVAHARSALFGSPVGLAETLENLPQWSEELAELTAGQLIAFGRGEPIALGSDIVPGTADPEHTDRRARRSDVRFYITQLFELGPKERGDFAKLCKERLDVPLIELAASVRSGSSVEKIRQRIAQRSLECSEDLAELAAQLELDARPLSPAEKPELSEIEALGARIEALVGRFETRRREVEDDCASALFAEAFGFSAGRIEPEILFESVDLRWIASLLGWDAERTSQWLAGARRRERESAMRGRVERMVAELEVGAGHGELPTRIFERWAEPFVARREQWLLDGLGSSRDLVVLADLDLLFETHAREDEPSSPVLLPFQDPRFAAAGTTIDWQELSRAELGPGATDDETSDNARAWEAAFEDGFGRDFLLERSRGVIARWEQDLQREIRAALQRRSAGASNDGGSKLLLNAARLDRASERARYILKDRGSRPQVLARGPSYATVLLLTRHRDRFAGLRVEDTTERVRTVDERGIAVADGLIGRVAGLTLREALLEDSLRSKFDELRRKAQRSEREQADLRWMARRLLRDDEGRGRSGVEAYFDFELAGRNGYREVRGYQEMIDGAAQVDVPPQDGSDVVLTLDLDLQAAATQVFTAPEADPDPISNDYQWLANPTGAIVLMTVEGDVLAAVSYPDFVRGEGADVAPRDLPFERTLRKPTFQPPGSCFKPFVAAWALEHKWVDPFALAQCGPLLGRTGSGYVDVRCNATHGAVDMRSAIRCSCNAYFARLGEHIPEGEWPRLAAEFGFGEATGVRAFGDRDGLMEDHFGSLFGTAPRSRSARLAGNGLAVVEATPMQVARATAALATGNLPDVRLVRRVGASETPVHSRPLSLSPATLATVREAMLAVSEEREGSAQRALNSRELGFRIGSKTGSADIGTATVVAADGRERVRKHAWLIGFFPYEAPRYVIVVFCHDTLATSSHNAVWLARQYLTSAAVRALMQGDGR